MLAPEEEAITVAFAQFRTNAVLWVAQWSMMMGTSSSDGTPRVHLFEKVEKLGGPVPLVAFADDEAGGDIERGEERCGAMPDIGVGPALGHAGHHW